MLLLLVYYKHIVTDGRDGPLALFPAALSPHQFNPILVSNLTHALIVYFFSVEIQPLSVLVAVQSYYFCLREHSRVSVALNPLVGGAPV